MTNQLNTSIHGNESTIADVISLGFEESIPVETRLRSLTKSQQEFQNNLANSDRPEAANFELSEPLQPLKPTESIAKFLSQKLISNDDLVNFASDRKASVEFVENQSSISHFSYGCGSNCLQSHHRKSILQPERFC